ncbi:antitoxin [Streptomyces griseus]|uniref:antitoxin n=1 Tax=Streptomyces griseus TaxID=1911 RepID=UPI000566FEFB|nr:antitoxin [Streptomyces griseus]
MGLLHTMKAKLGPAKHKVSDLAQRHEGKVHHGLDKAAKVVDEKTGHKYSGKIHTGTGKAKDAMERLAHKDPAHEDGDTAGGGPTTPPGSPPPTS